MGSVSCAQESCKNVEVSISWQNCWLFFVCQPWWTFCLQVLCCQLHLSFCSSSLPGFNLYDATCACCLSPARSPLHIQNNVNDASKSFKFSVNKVHSTGLSCLVDILPIEIKKTGWTRLVRWCDLTCERRLQTEELLYEHTRSWVCCGVVKLCQRRNNKGRTLTRHKQAQGQMEMEVECIEDAVV